MWLLKLVLRDDGEISPAVEVDDGGAAAAVASAESSADVRLSPMLQFT